MNLLIIDETAISSKNYQPQFMLSQLDQFEYSLTKFETPFIFIDDINLFYKMSPLPKNAKFLIDRDIIIHDDRIKVKKVKYTFNKENDFKKKIVKHDYIFNWLFKE